MSSQLQQAFEIIRTKCTTDTDRGSAFEQLVKMFLENDAVQTQEYEKVWHYRDWAKDRPNYTNKDIGIDLVAQIRSDGTYCAIQCKFYAPEHQITKADLDSLTSAVLSSDFTRLILIDTCSQDIAKDVQAVLDNTLEGTHRIPISALEESQIDWLTYVRDECVHLNSKQDTIDDKKEPYHKTKIIVDALIANDEFELAFEETKKFLHNVGHLDKNLIFSSYEWVYETQIDLLDQLEWGNRRIVSTQELYDKLFELALKRKDKPLAIKWKAKKAAFEWQCADRAASDQARGEKNLVYRKMISELTTASDHYRTAMETYRVCYDNFRMNSDKLILKALYEMLNEQYGNTTAVDDDEAITVCLKMIEIGALLKEPNLVDIVDELGHALEDDRKFHDARKIYSSFIQYAQQSHQEYILKARLYEARCHASEFDHKIAIEKLNALLRDAGSEEFDDYSYAMRLLATYHEEEKNYEKAIACWDEVMLLSIVNPEEKWEFAISSYGKITAMRNFLKSIDERSLKLERKLYSEVWFFLETVSPYEGDADSMECDINDAMIKILFEFSNFQWQQNTQLNEKDMLEKAVYIIDNFMNKISPEVVTRIRDRLQDTI